MTKKVFLLNLIEHIFNVDSTEVIYETCYGGGLTMKVPEVGKVWCFADYSKRTNKVSLKFKNKAFKNFNQAQVQKIYDYLIGNGFDVNVEIYESTWLGGFTSYVCHADNEKPKYLRIIFNDGYPWEHNKVLQSFTKVEPVTNDTETNDKEVNDLDVIKQSLVDIIGLSSNDILNLVANQQDSIMNDLATIRAKAKDAIEYINKYMK